MTNAKKAMVFQHNKTALVSAYLIQRVRILTLADRLDLMLKAKMSLIIGNASSSALGQSLKT
jgi:hypothetical protein